MKFAVINLADYEIWKKILSGIAGSTIRSQFLVVQPSFQFSNNKIQSTATSSLVDSWSESTV